MRQECLVVTHAKSVNLRRERERENKSTSSLLARSRDLLWGLLECTIKRNLDLCVYVWIQGRATMKGQAALLLVVFLASALAARTTESTTSAAKIKDHAPIKANSLEHVKPFVNPRNILLQEIRTLRKNAEDEKVSWFWYLNLGIGWISVGPMISCGVLMVFKIVSSILVRIVTNSYI